MNSMHRLYVQRLLTCLMMIMMLTGCLSPLALNRAVLAYDDAVTDAASQQLLINIVRAHHRHAAGAGLSRRGLRIPLA